MWEVLAAVRQYVGRSRIVGSGAIAEVIEEMKRYLICLKPLVGYFVKKNAVLKFVSFKNSYQSFFIFWGSAYQARLCQFYVQDLPWWWEYPFCAQISALRL